MFDLIRYAPIGRMRDYVDRFFQESLPVSYREFLIRPEHSVPVVDIIEKEDHYLVKAEVPGYKREELDISIEGDVLTLKGERNSEKEEEKENYYYKESSYGSFSRSFKLSSETKIEEIKASLKDGILSIELPKAEEKKPAKVEIEEK